MKITTEQITLPALHDLGLEPVIASSVYEGRVAKLQQAMAARGLDAVLVYADREHHANTTYLVGFDPRFEEAVVVVPQSGIPTAITGMECQSLIPGAGYRGLKAGLCQAYGLPGQNRTRQPRLYDALAATGLPRSAKIGVVGWKPVGQSEAPDARLALAVPQFVMAEIESYFGADYADATEMLMGNRGMRSTNDALGIALIEHRSARASQMVWRGLEALRPGMSERDVARAMQYDGPALSAHLMCTSGTDGAVGLLGATDRVIAVGDAFSTAVSLWGGLTSRAARVMDASHPEFAGYVESFAGPYFAGIRKWYAMVKIGTVAGEVADAVVAQLARDKIELALNPGHLMHMEEWLDSPFVPDGKEVLRSGMAIQVDMIPFVAGAPRKVANLEDGIVLADAALRAELARDYPQTWARMQARRKFMIDVLGFELSEDILPLCDRQGAFAPGLLSLNTILKA